METSKKERMRIAIPLADGTLSVHFGHCERFALVDVDSSSRKVVKRKDIEAPPHQPGLLPLWLAARGAECIIAGGMGQRAQSLFAEQGIKVVVGAPSATPERLVTDYLEGKLQVGENACVASHSPAYSCLPGSKATFETKPQLRQNPKAISAVG